MREVEEVEGERMVVVGGKREAREEAILGVWDVPPERMTWGKRISLEASIGGRMGREKEKDGLRRYRAHPDQLSAPPLLSNV